MGFGLLLLVVEDAYPYELPESSRQYLPPLAKEVARRNRDGGLEIKNNLFSAGASPRPTLNRDIFVISPA